MTQFQNFSLLGLFLLFTACGSGGNQQQQETSESGEMDAQEMQVSLDQVWDTDTTSLITPECATYNPEKGVFYISNLNRDNDNENDGYISVVNADGTIKNARWTEGLASPLGNDYYNGHVYVNDNGTIVKISMENGSIVEKINVEGASDLNGMDIDANGNIYAADSDGNKLVKVSQDGEVTVIYEGEDLNTPNGVYYKSSDELIVASSAGNKLLSLDLNSKELSTLVEGIGRADGIVPLDGGHYLTSSWTGEVYFISSDMKKQKILDTKAQEINAADIGYIPEENLMVVPTFYDNRLVAYKVNIN